MTQSVNELFQFARSRVSPEDIAAFVPNDPGYGDYVRLWTEIHQKGVVPSESSFDLEEVIGMTSWADPLARQANAERFRAFRRFTSAVALKLVHQGHDVERIRPANYLARDLLIDLMDSDPFAKRIIEVISAVFRDTRTLLLSSKNPEFVFFTLGLMILAQLNDDWPSSEAAADRLLCDEQQAREMCGYFLSSDEFLFCLTHYNQLNDDWRR